MEIATRQFGKVTIDETKIIIVPKGIPGFPDFTRYILLDHEEIRPFVSLQCVDDVDLSFFLMDPFSFKPDYKIDTKPYIKEMSWDENDKENTFVYVIVNVTDNDPKKITANLLGPLLINIQKNQAVQMLVSDGRYTHKHLIFANNKKKEKNAENNTGT